MNLLPIDNGCWGRDVVSISIFYQGPPGEPIICRRLKRDMAAKEGHSSSREYPWGGPDAPRATGSVFYEPVWSSPLHFFSRLAVVFLSQGVLSSSPVPHSLSGRP